MPASFLHPFRVRHTRLIHFPVENKNSIDDSDNSSSLEDQSKLVSDLKDLGYDLRCVNRANIILAIKMGSWTQDEYDRAWKMGNPVPRRRFPPGWI